MARRLLLLPGIMANATLFRSSQNQAGGTAFAMSPKQSLAQLAATGCFNQTFYAGAEAQLADVLRLGAAVDAGFLARTALYAREKSAMKDMPAMLCALLSVRDPGLLARVFDRVIDDARMLRTFVQIVRSGAAGRKSLGSRPKKLVQRWFESRDDEAIFRSSVGDKPSLADVIRLSRPRPANRSREALYGWLVGREVPRSDLPPLVQRFERYREQPFGEAPDVPFQMLTSLQLGVEQWTAIVRTASWQTTRINLNTFARHGVYEVPGMVELVANRLRNPQLVKRARALPYQLMAAWNQSANLPEKIREALQDAMEIALENVPRLEGRVFVMIDVSGSMSSPVTGHRKGATTVIRCIDVAALFAAALLRKNADVEVLPFADDVREVRLNRRDTLLTNAAKLSALLGGGTRCSAPLAKLNRERARGEMAIFLSDNQSWMDSGGRGSATMREWETFRSRNRNAKLVCVDLQPYLNTQAAERADILNVGGFSDAVFERVAEFADPNAGPDGWVRAIEAIEL